MNWHRYYYWSPLALAILTSAFALAQEPERTPSKPTDKPSSEDAANLSGVWTIGGTKVEIEQNDDHVVATFKDIARNQRGISDGDVAFEADVRGKQLKGFVIIRAVRRDGSITTIKGPATFQLDESGQAIDGSFDNRKFSKSRNMWTDETRRQPLKATRVPAVEQLRFVRKQEYLGVDLDSVEGTFVETQELKPGFPYWLEVEFDREQATTHFSAELTASTGQAATINLIQLSKTPKVYRSDVFFLEPVASYRYQLGFGKQRDLDDDFFPIGGQDDPQPLTAELKRLRGDWQIEYLDKNLGRVTGVATIKSGTPGQLVANVTLRHPTRNELVRLFSHDARVEDDSLKLALVGHSPSGARVITGKATEKGRAFATVLLIDPRERPTITARFLDETEQASLATIIPIVPAPIQLEFDFDKGSDLLTGTWKLPFDENTGFLGRRYFDFNPDDRTLHGPVTWTRKDTSIERVVALDMPKFEELKDFPENEQKLCTVWLRVVGRHLPTGVQGDTVEVDFADEKIRFTGEFRPDPELPGALNIRVDLLRQVEPGAKRLVLNNADGTWDFDFPDLQPSRVTFVRNAGDPSSTQLTLRDGDRFFVEVGYPFVPSFTGRTADVWYVLPQTESKITGARTKIRLQQTDFDKRTFRSGPLVLRIAAETDKRAPSPVPDRSGKLLAAPNRATVFAALPQSTGQTFGHIARARVDSEAGRTRIFVRDVTMLRNGTQSLRTVLNRQPFYFDLVVPQSQARELGHTAEIEIEIERSGAIWRQTLRKIEILENALPDTQVYSTANALTVERDNGFGLNSVRDGDAFMVKHGETLRRITYYVSDLSRSIDLNEQGFRNLAVLYSAAATHADFSSSDRAKLTTMLELLNNAQRGTDRWRQTDKNWCLIMQTIYHDQVRSFAHHGSRHKVITDLGNALRRERQLYDDALDTATIVRTYELMMSVTGANDLFIIVLGIDARGVEPSLFETLMAFIDSVALPALNLHVTNVIRQARSGNPGNPGNPGSRSKRQSSDSDDDIYVVLNEEEFNRIRDLLPIDGRPRSSATMEDALGVDFGEFKPKSSRRPSSRSEPTDPDVPPPAGESMADLIRRAEEQVEKAGGDIPPRNLGRDPEIQAFHDAFGKFHEENNLPFPSVSVIDADAFNKMRQGGYQSPIGGGAAFSPPGVGALREGTEAVRVRPGRENYVRLREIKKETKKGGDGLVVEYSPSGGFTPDGPRPSDVGTVTTIPTENFQHFEYGPGKQSGWVDFSPESPAGSR